MEKQKKRIAEFLDGIIDSSLPAEQQIVLFSEEEDVEGAATANENGRCTNQSVGCEGSFNGFCTNYDTYCVETSNDDCSHKQTLDFSIESCGGEGGDT